VSWKVDEAERLRKLRQARAQGRNRMATRNVEAEKRWRSGYVIPARITMMLDLRGLYGPEVDVACGVEEPTVDQWEAGEVYPSWEQLQALARLCDVGVIWFTDAMPWRDIGPVFICDRSKRTGQGAQVTPEPILRASREALAAHRATLETT